MGNVALNVEMGGTHNCTAGRTPTHHVECYPEMTSFLSSGVPVCLCGFPARCDEVQIWAQAPKCDLGMFTDLSYVKWKKDSIPQAGLVQMRRALFHGLGTSHSVDKQ